MPRRPTLSRRLATAALWPVGVSLTSWNYLWRTTPMHRSEEEGTPEDDAPPLLPDALSLHEVQPPGDGTGPLFHRVYRTRVRNAHLAPEQLVDRVVRDLNAVTPTEFARFFKVRGGDDGMSAGDEYVVRMPGPWDGPVRVADVTPISFRFVTLEGHLEAGQIAFEASRDPDGLLVFTIESWARSSDRLTNLLYDRLRMAKEVQLHMWISVLEGIVKLAGGRMTGGIEIRTRRVDA